MEKKEYIVIATLSALLVNQAFATSRVMKELEQEKSKTKDAIRLSNLYARLLKKNHIKVGGFDRIIMNQLCSDLKK